MKQALKEIAQRVAQNSKLVIVEDYEIGVEEKTVDSASFSANNKNTEKKEKEFLVSLRLLHRKRLGESYTTAIDAQALNTLVESAIEAAEATLPCPWFRFPIWRTNTADLKIQSLTEFSLQDFIPPEGVLVTFSREQKQKRLQRKTEKVTIEQVEANTAAEIKTAVFVAGNEIIFCEKVNNPESLTQISKVAQTLFNQRKYFSVAVPFSLSAKEALVFSPSVSCGILQLLSDFFAADKEISDCISSTKVSFSNKIEMIEQGGEGFDLEGVVGQKVTLINHGKLQSLLHNTTTGAKHNRPGTGSLRKADFKNGAKISSSNLYLEKGNKSIAELIASVSDGVYLEVGTNWELFEQGGKHLIRFDALGWKIENGEGKYSVYCEKVAFPILRYLEKIEDLSNQIEWHGPTGSPATIGTAFLL